MIKKISASLNVETNPEPVIIKTVEEAVKYRHIGGPTIQINGLDIEPDARNIKQHLAWPEEDTGYRRYLLKNSLSRQYLKRLKNLSDVKIPGSP